MGSQCVRPTNDNARQKRGNKEQQPSADLYVAPQARKNHLPSKVEVQQRQSSKQGVKPQASINNESPIFCIICKQKYNTADRQPIQICQQGHIICSTCKEMLLATKIERYKVCPFCKRLLSSFDMKVNEKIMAKLQ